MIEAGDPSIAPKHRARRRGHVMSDGDSVRQWLSHRADQHCTAAVDTLLQALTEDLAVAVGEAVTVRELSADGLLLTPLAVHHIDPERGQAMAATMQRTVDKADRGLWAPVIEQRRPVRWRVPPSDPPAEASPQQVAFLARNPVTAILGVPLLWEEVALGGLSIVRYSVDRPFDDADQALAVAAAARIALTLGYRRTMRELSCGPLPPATPGPRP